MSKIAIVTGGAGDIGRAVCIQLANAGYGLIVLDMNRATGEEAVNALKQQGRAAEFFCANLADEAEVAAVFAKLAAARERVDLLVNVAGGSLHRHKFEDFPLDHWRAVIDANVTSAFLCCRAVVPGMKKQKSGNIINISSDIAFSGGENRSAYAAAKGAILGLSKTLALELAPFGVRVNTVAPGRVATPRVKSHYTDADWAASNKRIPLGQAGTPEDVAELVGFLASDASKHMTGQTVHVNGGRIMR